MMKRTRPASNRSARRPGQRSPGILLALTALLIAGCGGVDGDADHTRALPDSAANRTAATETAPANPKLVVLVEAVLDAYGGREVLEGVEAYRCEGRVTAEQWPEQGETVRWFEHPDRLRIEMRHRDRGDLRIVRGEMGWTGTDDQNLVPLGNEFFRSTYLQAARMALPLRLAEDIASLTELAPDAAGRRVLRLAVGEGLNVDSHIDEKTYRIEAVTLHMLDPEPVVVRVELSEFRSVDGMLFPFREEVFAGEIKTATVRFRSVTVNPDTPVLLFSPDGDY